MPSRGRSNSLNANNSDADRERISRRRSMPDLNPRQEARGHDDDRREKVSEGAECYPNRFPALPVFNNRDYALKLEKVKDEAKLPLDTWQYDMSVMNPPAEALGPVFRSKRQAWKETGWVHCDKFLGAGCFGKVYLGFRYEDRHRSEKEPLNTLDLCAIKEIEIRKGSMEKVDRSVAMEVYCLRALAHVNIVRYFTSYSIPSKKLFYFVLEFADALDLHHEIVSHPTQKHLSDTYARELFRGIVYGVEYMHWRGVAHCDLKPENILLKISADGKTKTPKIADFGLSSIFLGKHLPQGGQRESFLETRCAGTPTYMAPELLWLHARLSNQSFLEICHNNPIPVSQQDTAMGFKDERNSKKRRVVYMYDEYWTRKYQAAGVDVYALGVTLYRMLTGSKPFVVHKDGKWTGLEHVFRCEPIRNRFFLTKDTFDFICEMLEPDTSQRLSIQGVKLHHWMYGPISGPIDPKPKYPAPSKTVYVSLEPSVTTDFWPHDERVSVRDRRSSSIAGRTPGARGRERSKTAPQPLILPGSEKQRSQTMPIQHHWVGGAEGSFKPLGSNLSSESHGSDSRPATPGPCNLI